MNCEVGRRGRGSIVSGAYMGVVAAGDDGQPDRGELVLVILDDLIG